MMSIDDMIDGLFVKNKQLEQKLTEANAEIEKLKAECVEGLDILQSQASNLALAEEALGKYSVHQSDCEILLAISLNASIEGRCDCGLDTTLNKLKEGRE